MEYSQPTHSQWSSSSSRGSILGDSWPEPPAILELGEENKNHEKDHYKPHTAKCDEQKLLIGHGLSPRGTGFPTGCGIGRTKMYRTTAEKITTARARNNVCRLMEAPLIGTLSPTPHPASALRAWQSATTSNYPAPSCSLLRASS